MYHFVSKLISLVSSRVSISRRALDYSLFTLSVLGVLVHHVIWKNFNLKLIFEIFAPLLTIINIKLIYYDNFKHMYGSYTPEATLHQKYTGGFRKFVFTPSSLVLGQ